MFPTEQVVRAQWKVSLVHGNAISLPVAELLCDVSVDEEEKDEAGEAELHPHVGDPSRWRAAGNCLPSGLVKDKCKLRVYCEHLYSVDSAQCSLLSHVFTHEFYSVTIMFTVVITITPEMCNKEVICQKEVTQNILNNCLFAFYVLL